jgi:hypothetical protein
MMKKSTATFELLSYFVLYCHLMVKTDMKPKKWTALWLQKTLQSINIKDLNNGPETMKIIEKNKGNP